MKFATHIIAASVAVFCNSAPAQFVKGNEAVRSGAQGRVVDTPPIPSSVGKACNVDAKCHASAWRMVETKDGLVECTDAFARPGTCRASTYGTQKLPRLWVVKRGGEWSQCQFPDTNKKCVPMFARPPANLPVDAIQ